MKIALIYPDYLPGTTPRSKRLGFYSEGIASISAVLKASGHSVRLVHLTAPALRGDIEDALAKWDPHVVGFSTRSSNFKDTVRYAAWIKADPRIRAVLVAGGYHATLDPGGTLAEGVFDFVLGGQADFTFRDFCGALCRGSEYDEIPGLFYRSGGKVRSNLPGRIVDDLDSIPYPDVGVFEVGRLESYALKTAPAILSRGCPFTCSYCCNAAFRAFHGNPKPYLRYRSPENSIGYLKAMLSHFPNAKYVSFLDNILPLKIDWFRRFSYLYSREIGLPYACNARADILTEEAADLLFESGCYRVHFGVESGDPELRKEVLGRGMSNDSIRRAFRLCQERGIAALAYNMVGLPGETLDLAWKTVRFNASLPSARVLAPTFYPYPGSRAYETSLLKGRVVEDPSGQVFLDQPGFTWREARFASLYFRLFVRLCRLAGYLPVPLRDKWLAFLKSLFCFRRKPHGLLIAAAVTLVSLREAVLSAAKSRLGDTYLRLRDRSLRAGRAA
ncbi:MAG TPA: B12-binding domain-containing radical SAM protein [Clostridia bacterium]|nr:B12-binding domain-containing radical SAM protein [Clostridia bacterium]